MPDCRIQLAVVNRILENDTCFSEVVTCPELTFFSDSCRRSLGSIIKLARRDLENLGPKRAMTLHASQSLAETSVEVEVKPAKRSPAWEEPVLLRLDVLTWSNEKSVAVAYVPALQIAVIADRQEQLEKVIEPNIRLALAHKDFSQSLWHLSQLQRSTGFSVERHNLTIRINSPKERLRHLAKNKDDRKTGTPTLKKVCTAVEPRVLPRAYCLENTVQRIAEALKGSRAGNVLLVGPSGVGKTAAVQELVRKHSTLGLGQRTFLFTSGARLVAGMGGFGMWQQRCRRLCDEAGHIKAILHVGRLMELMHVGKSIHNNIGMASFLRPYMLKGDLNIIAECTAEELPAIEREDPHLLQAFQQIEMQEPGHDLAREILLNVALEYATQRLPEAISLDGIDLLDRLHRRYAAYSAYPGRPIRFLRNLVKDARGRHTLGTTDVLTAFSKETGMPRVLLDETSPLDLEKVLAWFEDRVLGQAHALKRIVDLLSIIKTRMARPDKPLASLLFAGPTGVGKTETAKVLAAYLFGDRERVVRFDMSEYADPYGYARLIGGHGQGEGLLTRSIREQPFAVLLLDEFEKAHPATFDLLLQVLGEGRLSDQAGRVADFRNAVVIMTSNLGSEVHQKAPLGITGTLDVRGDARDHFVSAVKSFLRPEMYNRLDAIIPFSPLDRSTVESIAAREMASVLKREGVARRNLDLLVDDGVAESLAQRGFDSRYGARPIKRAFDEALVAPLASRLNDFPQDLPLSGIVSCTKQGLVVDISPDVDASRQGQRQRLKGRDFTALIQNCSELRRRAQKLTTSERISEIENEIYQRELQREKARRLARQKNKDFYAPHSKTLSALQTLVDDAAACPKAAAELEERCLLAYYTNEELDLAALKKELKEATESLETTLLRLHAQQFERPDHVVLGIFGTAKSLSLVTLFRAYTEVIKKISGRIVSAESLSVTHDASLGKRVLQRLEVKDLIPFLHDPPTGVIGLVLQVQAPMAYPLFVLEEGLHTFKYKDGKEVCQIHASDAEWSRYNPPRGLERKDCFKAEPERRRYNYESGIATEQGTENKRSFNRDNLAAFLVNAMQAQLLSEAQTIIDNGPE